MIKENEVPEEFKGMDIPNRLMEEAINKGLKEQADRLKALLIERIGILGYSISEENFNDFIPKIGREQTGEENFDLYFYPKGFEVDQEDRILIVCYSTKVTLDFEKEPYSGKYTITIG